MLINLRNIRMKVLLSVITLLVSVTVSAQTINDDESTALKSINSLLSAKDIQIDIDTYKITVEAKIDSSVTSNEFSPRRIVFELGSKIKNVPHQIKTTTTKEITSIGNTAKFMTTRTVTVFLKDGEPTALSLMRVDYAAFDVPEFIESIKGNDFANPLIKELEKFDEMGFRVRKFQASFDQKDK